MSKIKNICVITSSLGEGGAEKVAALHTHILEDLGYNVFVVSVLNQIEFSYAGTLLNLGELKDQSDSFLDSFRRLFVLKRFLKENKIDLIVDHRSRNHELRELILKFTIYKTKVIFMIHSMNLKKAFSRYKLISLFLYKNASSLVCVSKAIEERVREKYGFSNLKTIYNCFKNDVIKLTTPDVCTQPFILFFGRLDEDAKDLTFLIKAYQASNLPSKGIQLLLVGKGPDELKLKKLVTGLDLDDWIVFKGHTSNPFSYVKKAMFTVLTSHYEGYPMSLIESLACETPVVSVNCESGPSEIIINKHNGLLVEKTLENFSKAMNTMVSEEHLLENCRENSLSSIQHLSYSNIKKEWELLLKSI